MAACCPSWASGGFFLNSRCDQVGIAHPYSLGRKRLNKSHLVQLIAEIVNEPHERQDTVSPLR